MLGKLYIVATPIGNLQDITFRAVKILSEVEIILAEDTRVTRKLLDFINSNFQFSIFNPKSSLGIQPSDRGSQIKARLVSYHHHSGFSKKNIILKELIGGKDIALVTDAGTPGVSDPGNELIDYLQGYEPCIKVVPIPGPSALTAALSVCGFNVGKHIFVGFLPKKKLGKIFTQVKNSGYAFVFFESPNRILKTLDRLIKDFGGERRVFVGRELTKMYEETYRGRLFDVRDRVLEGNQKGEVVVVLESERRK